MLGLLMYYIAKYGIMSIRMGTQNPPPNLTLPFINKDLQQFCLHLNINNNTLQTLGYLGFRHFDGESGERGKLVREWKARDFEVLGSGRRQGHFYPD